MNQQSLLRHIVFAVSVCIAALFLNDVLQGFLNFTVTNRLLSAIIVLSYLVFLIRENRLKAGWLTLTMSNLTIVCVAGWLLESYVAFVLASLWLIWLNRCVLKYKGIVDSLTDLILTIISFGAMQWAWLQTGNLSAAWWCFLLLQSLHVFIPGRGQADGENAETAYDNFDQSMQTAEQALRRILKKG